MFRKFFQTRKIDQIQSDIAHLLNKFSINDPTTPDLVIDAQIPPVGVLKYAVKDMNPIPKSINETRAVNCHISIGNCIKNVQSCARNQIKSWAATNLLQVYPAAGAELNAYYDRRSLKFFYYRFEGKNFYFSDSQDIVNHELGHAILDAMRPDFWSVQSLEIWSFHEAFSDIVSIFNVLNYDIVLEKILEETNGDLSVSNTASKLAEEVGILIRKVTNDDTYLANALRDPAIEYFAYSDPSSLPKDAENNKLAAECHSFGRVFSNAWYNILIRMFEYYKSLKNPPITALKMARDMSFSILIQAIPNSARVSNYYSNMASAMVAVASSKGTQYAEIVRNVFLEWNILKNNEVRILSDMSWKKMTLHLKKNDKVFKNSKITTVCVKENKLIKFGDLPIVSSLSLSPDLEIEVPSDSYYEFNNNGDLTAENKPDEQQIRSIAGDCLLSISNLIGKNKSENKMWVIENNRLVRNFIS